MDKNKDLVEEGDSNLKKDKSDQPKPSIKGKLFCVEQYMPHILEIHYDNTRSRVLFVVTALLVYCFATFLIFQLDVKSKAPPKAITQENKIPKQISIGRPFSDYGSHHISLNSDEGVSF